MNRIRLFPLLCAALVLLASAPALFAQSEAELVASMEQRLPELMRLKLDGQVGENELGLVEPRGDLSREARRLVGDENRDRLALYELMAGRLDIPVRAVQEKRAEQIRQSSPEGVWLESAKGEWYRK